MKDLSVRLPSILGEKSTVILYQIKIPVSVDPACQTKAVHCSGGGLCFVNTHAHAQSTSGGAGVVVQLQRVDIFTMLLTGLTRWVDVGPSFSCRRNGANQSCDVDALHDYAYNGDTLRAVCRWKSKQGTIDQNAKITVCQINVFPIT